MHHDTFDLKILSELQKDGRLTNNELCERVGLSPSQCSRRRTRLEKEGTIQSYHAHLNPGSLGLGFMVIITVTLHTHTRDNAKQFSRLIGQHPEVLEAYSLTGDMDYTLKVATANLEELSRFLNNILLPHPSVQHVKSSIVLETLKEFSGLPLPTV